MLLTTAPSFDEALSAQEASPDSGLSLCPCLTVPTGSRFTCLIKDCIRKKKQSVDFHVRSPPASLCRPLFRIDVSEFGNRPGIAIQSIDGMEELAFLSTEALWNSSSGAQCPLDICRPQSGATFASVQPNTQPHEGGYQVLRGASKLMDLKGDFTKHTLAVTAANGQFIAMTRPYMPDEYELSVFSGVDAGLVLLALLAADKFRE